MGDGVNTIEKTIPVIASYADTNLTKGTIEERLNKKQTVTLLYSDSTGIDIGSTSQLLEILSLEKDIDFDYFDIEVLTTRANVVCFRLYTSSPDIESTTDGTYNKYQINMGVYPDSSYPGLSYEEYNFHYSRTDKKIFGKSTSIRHVLKDGVFTGEEEISSLSRNVVKIWGVKNNEK